MLIQYVLMLCGIVFYILASVASAQVMKYYKRMNTTYDRVYAENVNGGDN